MALAIIGASRVGKTALIRTLRGGGFNLEEDGYTPTIRESHTVKLDNPLLKHINVELKDTAGHSRNAPCPVHLTVNTDGYVVMYSAHIRESFEQACDLLQKLKDILGPIKLPITLLENQWEGDFKREITHEQGEREARNHNIKFYSISAIDGPKAKKVLNELIKEILQQKEGRSRCVII